MTCAIRSFELYMQREYLERCEDRKSYNYLVSYRPTSRNVLNQSIGITAPTLPCFCTHVDSVNTLYHRSIFPPGLL